jgi:hypothetical protein
MREDKVVALQLVPFMVVDEFVLATKRGELVV